VPNRPYSTHIDRDYFGPAQLQPALLPRPAGLAQLGVNAVASESIAQQQWSSLLRAATGIGHVMIGSTAYRVLYLGVMSD
jgi:ABC-type nitrate/sulfonate/bicarbonate transport system permease component